MILFMVKVNAAVDIFELGLKYIMCAIPNEKHCEPLAIEHKAYLFKLK